MDIVINNNLDKDMFMEYQDEFNYIYDFYTKYGKVPDKETFLSNFADFNIVDVNESDEYLLSKLNEEYLYTKTVPVVQKVAELLKTDSNQAVNYLMKELPNLTSTQRVNGIDIIKDADIRYREYTERGKNENKVYIKTGFEELDSIFRGLSRGEELLVLFARIGQGKSWILNKILASAWQQGNNVALISPEMSATKIGYRFDTLVNHFSNNNLNWRSAANRI